jgi:predicted DNA-binding transcriptional regulator AlpA
MREWSVLIEAWAPAGKRGSLDVTDSRVADLVDALAPEGGVVSADSTTWSVRLTVVEAEISAAIELAKSIVTTNAQQCRFPIWPIEHVEATEAERFAAQLEVSNFPQLVGTKEVAEILGVSRQRIHELRKAGRFPLPIIELGAGPIWLRPSIADFEAQWDRSPGRPSLVEQDLDLEGILGSGEQGRRHPESI